MRERADKLRGRLKTLIGESHNRADSTPGTTPLDAKLAALVRALARQAAEDDLRAERQRENGNGTLL